MDEIDGVVAVWHRKCPDLATSPMGVWSRIHWLAALLNRECRRCFAEYGPEVWKFDVLAALRHAGRPYRLSLGQLLQQTHVTFETTTSRVDQLHVRGLVTRRPDPSDGRATLVEPTATGHRAADKALRALVELKGPLLTGWPGTERRALAGMLRRLLIAAQD